MKRRTPRLLSIESTFPDANVMLRLLEPPGSCRETLREQVYSGSYDKPFVVDTGSRRFLHFDFAAVQSAMELSNPGRLTLAYTRKMMAFLLFNCTPDRILLLGAGRRITREILLCQLARCFGHGSRAESGRRSPSRHQHRWCGVRVNTDAMQGRDPHRRV